MTCTILSTGKELLSENKNENEQPYLRIKAKLYILLDDLFSQGYDCFYLNCEYGIPLWTAEILCAFKRSHSIKLHIVIPYEEQAATWQEELRNRYFRVHERADSVTMACTHYQPDCYSIAEHLMADQSNLLVLCGEPDDFPSSAQYAEMHHTKVLFYPVL